jgi:hypothetical protein
LACITGKGLGLGLATVKQLSNLLDLKMDFESSPGLGTHFTFKLPYNVRQSSVGHDAALQTESLAGIYVQGVDDEITVRRDMRMLLDTCSCELRLVDSTDEAIAAGISLKSNPIDKALSKNAIAAACH